VASVTPENERTLSATIKLESQVFDLDTIKRAAYRLPSNISIDIRVPNEPTIECHLVATSPLGEDEWLATIARFRRELLDQDLRRTISKETEVLRNVILGLAFSKTGLQDDV